MKKCPKSNWQKPELKGTSEIKKQLKKRKPQRRKRRRKKPKKIWTLSQAMEGDGVQMGDLERPGMYPNRARSAKIPKKVIVCNVVSIICGQKQPTGTGRSLIGRRVKTFRRCSPSTSRKVLYNSKQQREELTHDRSTFSCFVIL